jgi:hypothetical protein
MSDNIGYTPGTGATVAADNIGGALHQRVKISVGADGVAADASAENPVPVSDDAAEWLLGRIVSLLASPAGFDRSQARARVTAILESGTVTTVSTVSTVSAITALNNFGGLPAEAVARNQNQAAWQLCHRSTIT